MLFADNFNRRLEMTFAGSICRKIMVFGLE